MKASVLFTAIAGARARSGTETQCIGARAHTITYDMDGGDSLESIENATIDVAPADPAMNVYCMGKSGDHDFCVGGNTDDCKTPRETLAIDDVFSCDDCFAGLTTDLYYKLEIKWFSLQKVEVGLRNSHMRGALQVHAHKDVATKPRTGTIQLINQQAAAHIKFHIAGIIPFDLKLSMPTSLDYSLGLYGSLDAVAGAELDIDMGDHFMTFENGKFEARNTGHSVSLTPKIALNSGLADADIQLTAHSVILVDFDKVMTYGLSVDPSIPAALSFEHTAGEADKACIRADVDVPITHQADVHFSLLGKTHHVYTWPSHSLYHYHKDKAIDKCIEVPIADVVV